mgnify:CR=1 FL=1
MLKLLAAKYFTHANCVMIKNISTKLAANLKEWHSTKSKISNACNAKQFSLHPNNALILNVKLFLVHTLASNANSMKIIL